jgi:hypothetical protein
VPLPFTPWPPPPAGPLLSKDRIRAAVCETACRGSGVSARAAAAPATAAADSSATAHCHRRDRPLRAARSRGRLASIAMIQATGGGRGLVSLARIRSSPSSDGSSQSVASCSARRSSSS